jgi:hypothetical protein
LSSDITAALDGGQKAIAQRNHQAEVVIKMLRQLAHYAEANCKDDMTTFLKSGFEAASTTKSPSQALSLFIRKIDQGTNSGQLLVTIVAVPGASSYELRWAPLGNGGTPGPWTNQTVGKTRPPTSITGLTPGVTYCFRSVPSAIPVSPTGATRWRACAPKLRVDLTGSSLKLVRSRGGGTKVVKPHLRRARNVTTKTTYSARPFSQLRRYFCRRLSKLAVLLKTSGIALALCYFLPQHNEHFFKE